MTFAVMALIGIPLVTGLIAGAMHYVFTNWRRGLVECPHCDHGRI